MTRAHGLVEGFQRKLGRGSATNYASAPDSAYPGGRLQIRYLSSWTSNLVQIDISHYQRLGEHARSYDLAGIRIASPRRSGEKKGLSVYTKPQHLFKFPRLVSAIKHAINGTLHRNHKSKLSTQVSQTILTCQRVYSWMFSQGIYELADLEQAHLDELMLDLKTTGWRGVLHQQELLDDLLVRAQVDPALASSISGKSQKSDSFGVDDEAISREIGIPVDAIPDGFRNKLAHLVGDERPWKKVSKPEFGRLGELRQAMRTINLLALLPEGEDSISFYPFHNIEKSLNELFDEDSGTETPTQTPNLTVPDCIALMNESLKWMYEYGPKIIDLAQLARVSLTRIYDDTQASREVVRDIIKVRYREMASAMPYPKLTAVNKGNCSLVGIIESLLVALVIVIGCNHGRRANEMIGADGVHYGIYLGCLEEADMVLPEYQIEFYIEKGAMDYLSFPANVLVADAIRLAERVFQIFRPLNTPEIEPEVSLDDQRSQKLLILRNFTLKGFTSRPRILDFRSSMLEIFERAGVDPLRFDGTQMPFRRLFTTLFFRRYDLVEAPAMQQQLGHLQLRSTLPYQDDRKQRLPGESIDEIHGKRSKPGDDIDSMLAALAEGGTEYFIEKVADMIEGRSLGGVFPLMVAKLLKRLSADADFAKMNTLRKATKVVDILEKRGFSPNPMEHVACMADNPRHTGRKAKCSKDGKPHPENGNFETCCGCLHSFSNKNYLRALEDEILKCEAELISSNFPTALRSAKTDFLKRLKAVLEAEKKIAENSRAVMEKVVRVFNLTFPAPAAH